MTIVQPDKPENNHFIFNALLEAFPDDAHALFRLCQLGLSEPLGLSHPEVVEDLMGVEIDGNDREKIQVGYVMITAYYFLLDAVVDGHLDDPLRALYLTHFLSFACQKFDEVINSYPDKDVERFNTEFNILVSKNARAIRLENEFSANSLSFSEEKEYASIVGRSNSSIMLLELIGVLTSQSNMNQYKEILEDFAYFVQLGDDLADWREDYNANKYSTFLRELFTEHKRILSEQELEEEIYLSGIFEARALKVIKGLENTISKIEAIDKNNGSYLKAHIKHQVEAVKKLMTQVIEIKLLFNNSRRALPNGQS